MPKRFLNVEYSGARTEVDITTAERLGEVQDAIKSKYGEDIPAPASRIQIYDEQGQHINKWALFNSLPPEYFNEGGNYISLELVVPLVHVNSHSSQYQHFIVYHPTSTPTALLTPLQNLDKLLDNDELFSTFPLDLSPAKLKQILSEVKLKIHFVRCNDFNESIIPLREAYGDDLCCNGELGWFDSQISTTSIYINYDYYQMDGSNVQWLQMLIFITTMHELCHFFVHHAKVDSPTHQSFGEEKQEAGECWELQNLGGIVNHAARSKSPLLVEWLHTRTPTGNWYLSRSAFDQLNLIMTGEEHFPLILNTTVDEIAGLQKFKSERHCVDSPTNRPFIPYTGPPLIKHQRIPDRKGPRRK